MDVYVYAYIQFKGNHTMWSYTTMSPTRATAYPTKTPVLGVGQLPLNYWSRGSRRPQTALTWHLAAFQNLKINPLLKTPHTLDIGLEELNWH